MKIEVRQLRFRYSEFEPYVLDGVSFVIEPGESVALVGASGCGKSTLMNILLGTLTPQAGEIWLDGRLCNTADIAAARERMGMVLQDDVLFAGSVADNIAFFDPAADRERVMASARQAAIHEEIMAMPMGYDTLVGDMGTVFSGGQKQRILLARALYRKPDAILLDEATSHIPYGKMPSIRQLRVLR